MMLHALSTGAVTGVALVDASGTALYSNTATTAESRLSTDNNHHCRKRNF